MLDDADNDERDDSPRETPDRLVRLDDRFVLDRFAAAALDEPGIEMGDVEKLELDPASRRSVVAPSRLSVARLSRFEDAGVEPPEDWLRSRRPNSVLYMAGHGPVGRCRRAFLTRGSDAQSRLLQACRVCCV
jgi:hypothetical protein